MDDHRDGRIRIVVVDDHGLFRESLSRLLAAEAQLEVLPPCATVDEALELLENTSVDVVLLDYDLGDERGTRFLVQARERGLRPRTLILTAGMDDAAVLEVVRSGAAGIFLKHHPSALLLKAILRVAAGEVWFEQRYVRLALSHPVESRNGSRYLTARERHVLEGILDGLTSKEIAARLRLSESSVKNALRQLFAKTGARNRAQLVRLALEQYRDYL
ncbi:MAG: response regulator transcription factor [Bryobacterales bacterium]|nr:response regulator transcription factor [Bryobacteraceae bacterium]MDW8355298.1 response regulator transcription factor [Bryobacterales bacterium]